MAMLIERKKFNELPKGGRELTEKQVAQFYTIVVETWEKPFEIWALKFAPHFIGGASALTGLYLNRYFRKRLSLQKYGFISTYLPNIAIPYMTTASVHQTVYQRIS